MSTKLQLLQHCCGTCDHWYDPDDEGHHIGMCCWPREARACNGKAPTTNMTVCTQWSPVTDATAIISNAIGNNSSIGEAYDPGAWGRDAVVIIGDGRESKND